MTQSGNSCGWAEAGFAVEKTKNSGHGDSRTAAALKHCHLPRSLTNPIFFTSCLPILKAEFQAEGYAWWGKTSKPEQIPCL